MAEVDRAVTEGENEGFLRVHLASGSDRILGATVVGRHAGEMISEVTAGMVAGRGLRSFAGVIHPYPTRAEAIRKAADAANRGRLTPWVARLLRLYFRWRR
jgi:pyruvate/2-oxoglutarate dehydrogenase complex dihydrolipoamide dehydrogenase (E3) component